MTSIASTPGSGYTLPVFAIAAARAALQRARQRQSGHWAGRFRDFARDGLPPSRLL